MFSTIQLISLFLLCLPLSALSTRVVLTNDDGWAVAQIRAEYAALKAARYQVRAFPQSENGALIVI
jgi:5'-nucleotidase